MKLDGDKLLVNLNILKEIITDDSREIKPNSVKQAKINARRNTRIEMIIDIIDIVKSGDYTID